FTIGPGIAAAALRYLGPTGPGWIAAGLCALNLFLAWWRLPESWEPGRDPARPRPRLDQLRRALDRPGHGFLILTFALATFGFTCFESTLGLLIQQNFALARDGSATTNAVLFCFCGIIGATVQGGAIGRLIQRLGEARLIALSLVLFGLSMLPLPFIHGAAPLSWPVLLRPEGIPWILLLATVACLSIGSALTRPPLFGLLSSLTPPEEQGATLGVAQSAGSLARVLGPPWAGYLFDRHASWPYLACAALGVVLGVVAWRRLVGRLPLPPPSPSPA
ncbi:MAG: MFS transporter, partial [Verrucomicrobiota bacterium]